MSDRPIPFESDKKCDNCGKLGAFDFMGDYLCPECADKAIGEPEPCNRCGHEHCICGT